VARRGLGPGSWARGSCVGPTWGPQGAILPSAARTPWRSPRRTLDQCEPNASAPHCLQRCQRFVRVVRQGVPRRAQRKDHHRAHKIRRDDVTRWWPTLDVGEGLDPSHGSPQGAPLHCRRRPPADHPDGPPRVLSRKRGMSPGSRRWRRRDLQRGRSPRRGGCCECPPIRSRPPGHRTSSRYCPG
jgi:hypothetical protein